MKRGLFPGNFLNRNFSNIPNSQESLKVEEPIPKDIKEPVTLADYKESDILKNRMVKEGYQGSVGLWLLFMAAGVLGMISLGGYTRMSRSGLSMVKWKPLFYRYPQS